MNKPNAQGKPEGSAGLALAPGSATGCELCGGTGVVEIIPHGGGPNDAREDECPWCLRRKLEGGQGRCEAVTAEGMNHPTARCKFRARPGSRFCHVHGKSPNDKLRHGANNL